MTYYASNEDTFLDLPIWSNPAMIVLMILGFVATESGSNVDTIYDIIPLILFANLIYWIPATFVTIKIIDKITDKFMRKKSKAAVP